MISFIKPFKQLIVDATIPLDVVFFSILVILLPIALITGPAIPDIFLSLIALYFLIKTANKKLWYYYKSPIVWGFLIFSLYGILRSLFSDLPLESLTNEGSMFYFRYIFFALGVWYLTDNNPYLSKCLLYISLLCIFIVTFDGFYQYFHEVNLFGNKKFAPDRLTGLFGDEPIIGRYISYLTIFVFALIYQNFSNTKKSIILSISFLVLSEVIVFFSGERSPLFYLLLFSMLILVFIPHYRIYRLIGTLTSIVIIFSIIQFYPKAKERIVDLSISQMSETKIPFLPYSELHERHYITALKMFKDSPLFGVGTNTFRYECKKEKYFYKLEGCTNHPHHFYIQALAELGILGFTFIFTFFIYLSYLCMKQIYYLFIHKSSKQIPFDKFLFIMAIFVFWWPFIPHMSLYNNWNNVLMMLALGYLLKALKQTN